MTNGFDLKSITQKVMNIVASEVVDDEIKNDIIDSVTNELINNIGNISNVKDLEPEIYNILVKNVDDKISKYMGPKNISLQDCDKALSLCDYQKRHYKFFDQKGWSLPNIQNKDVDGCISYFVDVRESLTVQARIIAIDKEIDQAIKRAKKKITAESCEEALKLIDDLEKDINLCKSKDYPVPKTTYGNLDVTRGIISDIRRQVAVKEIVYQNIVEKDNKIDKVESTDNVTEAQCKETIKLLDEQFGLLQRCKKENWPCPQIKYLDFDRLKKKYQFYIEMLAVDQEIVESKRNITSDNEFNKLCSLCDKQARYIDRCKKNKATTPLLNVTDPRKLVDEIKKERQNQAKRKRRNKKIRTLIIVFASIGALLLSIGAICLIYFLSNNKFLPVASSDLIGKNVHDVVKTCEKAGFDTINTVPIETGWKRSGEVVNMSLMDKGKFYDKHTPITITYSSEGRVQIDDNLSDWRTVDCDVLAEGLRGEGLNNITINEVGTDEAELDNKIDAIKIGGSYYSSGEVYVPKNTKIDIDCLVYVVCFGKDSNEFVGADYKVVKNYLSQRGFTNIQTQEVTTGYAKGNTIISITVGGGDFRGDDYYLPDAPVIIRYSSADRVDITSILLNCKGTNYKEVRKKLLSAGIYDIELRTKAANTLSEDKQIAEISIDGVNYDNGSCYVHKYASIVITYYKTAIAIGQKPSYFKNKQYQDIVSELKKMGFSNIILKRSNDLLTGWLNKEGTIRSITINNASNFSDKDTFRVDAEIVIVVNTFKDRGCEDITDVA